MPLNKPSIVQMKSFVEAEKVSKNFYKNKDSYPALKNISLKIDKGSIFGIIGQSGAGKSTLLRCLSSLEKPTNGSIKVGVDELTKLSLKDMRVFRKKVGMIFQHFNLLGSLTVEENIALPLRLEKTNAHTLQEKVNHLLSLVNLEKKKDQYPSRLSGGEKQRVGIARALALDPQILFCDEATSALDPKMTEEILNLLQELNTKIGLTIVLITHQMEVIKKICHQVAVMDKGEIVETGIVCDIFSDPKHPTTKYLLQHAIHDLPLGIAKNADPSSLFLRLYFKGNAAKTPVISNLIKNFDVSVNILLGWIDSLPGTNIGTLTVEITGTDENKNKALLFLEKNQVRYEVLTHDLR